MKFWTASYCADRHRRIMYTKMKEKNLNRLDDRSLQILLKDRTTKKNIIWATDNYSSLGSGYQYNDHITIEAITRARIDTIRPRAERSRKEQADRIRNKAEVSTPSWICNKQNNLIDSRWFGMDVVFNEETGSTWTATAGPVKFPTVTKRSWQDYINDVRLEIACGEAPYLVSRYDSVSGDMIELSQRIGLLDRKLRIVDENTHTEEEWLEWAVRSYQNTYGYDWHGDSVLLARENLFLTFTDYYKVKFDKEPDADILKKIATVISWNIWQMDSMKFVVPNSCEASGTGQMTLFDADAVKRPCPGCAKNDPYAHTGIYCVIKNWKTNKQEKFIDSMREK